MIYLIGGAPRAGKSVLGQQISANLRVSWISTDLLVELLRVKGDDGAPHKWNAAPEEITAVAEWFYPYLERFVWGVSSSADHYVIDGVSFLPAQVVQLSKQYDVRAVFLGCSDMTLAKLDQFPGRSRGYGGLPEALRRQIAADVPRWSAFIEQECRQYDCHYVDTAVDFSQRLLEAATLLTQPRTTRYVHPPTS